MREIKFRAWHKADKRMVEVYGFSSNKWFLRGKQFPMPNGAVEIMQYTGLKDKNGKEIYEGDILKCKCEKHIPSGFSFETEIFYQNSVVEWWKSFSNIGYRLRNGKGKTLMVKPSSLEKMEVEVIGNIYVNPDLLEASK